MSTHVLHLAMASSVKPIEQMALVLLKVRGRDAGGLKTKFGCPVLDRLGKLRPVDWLFSVLTIRYHSSATLPILNSGRPDTHSGVARAV